MKSDIEARLLGSLDGLSKQADVLFRGFSEEVRRRELGVVGRALLEQALATARAQMKDMSDAEWQGVEDEIERDFARLFRLRMGSEIAQRQE
ncbi:MAG: hypothetical protein GY722_22790 [bacterium]|nr:hypothetical protein [bacterium]